MVSLAINILKAIENTYKKKYVGVLRIRKIKPFGYAISLGLSTPEKPIVIAAQIEDQDKFLDFFIKELRVGRFHEVKYFSTYRNLGCCYKHSYSSTIKEDLEEIVIYPPQEDTPPDTPEESGFIIVTPQYIYLSPSNNFTADVNILSNIVWNI